MGYNTGTDPTLAELITAKFIPEIFSRDVIMHTKSNLVVGNCVNTTYRKDLRKGYKVHIPVLSEIETTEVTPGTEVTPADAASATPNSITVDKWRYAAIDTSDMIDIEDPVTYMQKAAEAASYAIAKYVDTTLGAMFSTLGGSTVYGSDGQTFTDDIFIALVETLDTNDVPDSPRYLIGDPSMKADLLKIDKFVRNDYVRQPTVQSGQFGTLYNVKVLITNNLTAATTGNYGVLMHQDALGLVMQQNPRSQTVRRPDEFVTRFIVDVIFGCGELRDTFGKSFYTRSK